MIPFLDNYDRIDVGTNHVNQSKVSDDKGAFTYNESNVIYCTCEGDEAKKTHVSENCGPRNKHCGGISNVRPQVHNPWEEISFIYDRVFMMVHLLITVICFVAVFLFYRQN